MFLNNHKNMVKNIIKQLLKNPFISTLYLPYSCKKIIAFTLAEVLITLLIIGIVSSITIPTLIQETQNAEYKIAFKKGLANFSQAFMRMRMDNGGTLAGVFSPNHTVFKNTFRQYLNITDYSATGPTMSNATWHEYTYKRLNGVTELSTNFTCSGCPSASLNDGSFFMVLLEWDDNDLATCNLGGVSPKEGLCFDIMYDVNGKKLPNVIGRDIFVLAVYKNKVVPADWTWRYGNIDESTCSTSSTGYGCAIKYAKE